MNRALLVVLLFAAACAGTKPKPAQAVVPGAETPEVPRDTPDAGTPEAVRPDFKSNPGFRAAFERAVAMSERGDSEGAERELKLMVAGEPRLDYAWTNLGVLAERAGRSAEAETDYDRALEAYPDQVAAWDFLGRLFCRTRRAHELEARARIRVEQEPKSVGARLGLVQALTALKAYEPAALEAKKILKSDERNTRAMQLLSEVYFREGKLELAKLVLENARAIDPADAVTQNQLGLVQLQLKARPQAMAAFKEASTLEPGFAEARNNYGALLNETQDYEAGLQQLEGAAQLAPDLPSAHMNLGNAYRGLGQLEKAQAEYETALKLDPTLKDAYFNLAVLFLDGDSSKQDVIERLQQSVTFFKQYQSKGGTDEGVTQYVKDAQKGIDRETRRREREKKDALRKASKAAQQKDKEEKAATDSGKVPAPGPGK